MTQEEKDLLLKDLSGRLPYGVKVKFNNINILKLGSHTRVGEYVTDVIEPCKPYLFPLSNMTEEQKKEFSLITCDLNDSDYWRDGNMIYVDDKYQLNDIIDFYHKNHLDYRFLIPKGLAIDATDKNIY